MTDTLRLSLVQPSCGEYHYERNGGGPRGLGESRWVRCDPGTACSHARGQVAEARSMKARLKAKQPRPTEYVWPLWHEPRKARDTYTGPVGPIRDWRYEGDSMPWLSRGGVDSIPAGAPPPGHRAWLRRMLKITSRPSPSPLATAPAPPRYSAAITNAGTTGRKQDMTMAVPTKGSPQTPAVPPDMTALLATGWKPGDPLPTPPQAEESVESELARLRAENAHLKASKATGRLTIKSGPAGGVCVYGLGRHPATFYASQWLRILDIGEEIRAYIETHRATLKWKDA